MSYQTLAQKYRPQKFEDVVGQETITRTLKNSIFSERIANAYAFCGPRGVGKTSVARLIAKAMNCANPVDKDPCNQCFSCQEISQGNNMDVLEIDGASNNGVDEIRTLRENVKFSPSKSKFKVYIIDEVHMLSQGAFNALLKTLEEPPAHVKFIFATTEAHKVLPTIMSRCQRFDFKRISPAVISAKLLDIAQKEEIVVSKETALLIANAGDGSLRDSIVILDQMVSFSGRQVISDDVIELLGMVQKEVMDTIVTAIINNDPKTIINLLDDLISGGKDPVFIANSLIKYFRDIMILKTTSCALTSDMAFSEEETRKLKVQVEQLTLEEILYVLQNLTHCLTLMRNTIFARAPLEITLIKLTKRGQMLSLSKVLDELNAMDVSASGKTREVDVTLDTFSPSILQEEINGDSLKQTEREVEGNFVSQKTEPVELKKENLEENHPAPDKFNWNAVLNYIKKKKMSVFTFINPANPVQFDEKKLILGFGKDLTFNKEVLETETNKSVITEAVQRVTGITLQIEFVVVEFLGETKENTSAVQDKNVLKEKMKPIIETTMDVFGGQVVRDLMEGER
ncbi:MAG: DNA polymerase III subunit gamma/tau [Candidatus Omnitrophica bacterium]|nr:DNA polymerase III subunit gamma/tau [Candidatus Omnitrophota bacterium]